MFLTTVTLPTGITTTLIPSHQYNPTDTILISGRLLYSLLLATQNMIGTENKGFGTGIPVKTTGDVRCCEAVSLKILQL
jgi:hypothetical protein